MEEVVKVVDPAPGGSLPVEKEVGEFEIVKKLASEDSDKHGGGILAQAKDENYGHKDKAESQVNDGVESDFFKALFLPVFARVPVIGKIAKNVGKENEGDGDTKVGNLGRDGGPNDRVSGFSHVLLV